MFRSLLLCVLVGVLAVSGAWAATAPEEPAGASTDGKEKEGTDQPRGQFRQEIVVTAGLPELPSELRIAGREMVEEQMVDLVESVRVQPGLAAVRRGAINLDPNVRGLQETQVGMFIDGTRSFASGPGRMDSGLSHMTLHAVERMHVIKGPYALIWGAGALSAIQLESFRPPFRDGGLDVEGRAGFRFGENASSRDGYAGVWGSTDRWRFNVLLNTRVGDDYKAGGGEVVPADFESRDSRWSFGFRPREELLVEYLGGYQEQHDIDYPGRLLDATYFFTRSHAVEVRWNPAGRQQASLYGQLYVNRKDHLMNNDQKPTAQPDPDRMPPFGLDVRVPTESNTAGGRLHLTLRDGSWEWTLGTDFYRLEQTARRTIARRDTGMVMFEDIVWPDAEIDSLGLFTQGALQRGRYQVGATVRADLVDAAAGEVSEFFLDNTTGSQNQSETNLSLALSTRVKMSDHWVLSGGVGRAMRTASMLERYSDRFPSTKFQIAAEFMGDPEIEPETSLQADLGFELEWPRWVVRLDAFWRQIDDYITVEPDPDLSKRLPLSPPVVYRYINGEEAEFYGGELRLDQALSERLSWRGAASYVWGEDTTFNEPVFGLAPLTRQLGLRFAAPAQDHWVDVQATMVAGQDRVAEARLEQPTPGYTVYDLRGSFEVTAEWSVSAGVRNLTDKRYSNHLNSFNPFTRERISEIGRSLFVGVEYRF
jgi:iron complex outermembrane receptor protein